MSEKPITIGEIRELIKDLDNDVECYSETSNGLRPVCDIGIQTNYSTYDIKKKKRFLICLI